MDIVAGDGKRSCHWIKKWSMIRMEFETSNSKSSLNLSTGIQKFTTFAFLLSNFFLFLLFTSSTHPKTLRNHIMNAFGRSRRGGAKWKWAVDTKKRTKWNGNENEMKKKEEMGLVGREKWKWPKVEQCCSSLRRWGTCYGDHWECELIGLLNYTN